MKSDRCVAVGGWRVRKGFACAMTPICSVKSETKFFAKQGQGWEVPLPYGWE